MQTRNLTSERVLLAKLGLYAYAASIICLGLIQIHTGRTLIGLLPVSDKMPGKSLWVYTSGLLFVVLGAGLTIRPYFRYAAFWLGVFLLILLFGEHLRLVLFDLTDGSEWAVFLELLSLAAGGFMVAALDTGYPPAVFQWKRVKGMAELSKYVFAFCILGFGIEHLIYVRYIASLVPLWLPGPLVWAYVVMVGFTAAALSLLINIGAAVASTMLGCMYLIWVIILHGPLVYTHFHVEPQWTSLFVALGFAGISFIAGAQILSGRSRIRS